VFITTKFYPNRRDPVAEVEASLRLLDTDHVDLYIVRWPQVGPTWAWAGIERAWELGYVRSIGVSNFDAHEIDEVVAAAQVPPAVN
jgi:diketogulonate reductase-like aldo/keto reductase